MGTVLGQKSDPALAVTKSNQVFSQEPYFHRRAIGDRDLFGEQGRKPIPPHQLAHWRPRSYSGEKFVFLA